jgi:hypothetical protein
MSQNPSQAADAPTESAPHDLLEDTRALAHHAQDYYRQLQADNPIRHAYEQNPYAVIAGAIGFGYVLGGGLFTPFTRRVFRMGMRALVIPLVAGQIKALTQPPDPT